jgi:hypothetical protein
VILLSLDGAAAVSGNNTGARSETKHPNKNVEKRVEVVILV